MKQYNFLTQQEMIDLPPGQSLIFDIEVFRNFFFCPFKVKDTDDIIVFEADENKQLDTKALAWFVHRHRLIGFNSYNFDIPILTYALTGASCEEIKNACDAIINDGLRSYEFYKRFKVKNRKLAQIDLMEVCPMKKSLKEYGACLHANSIQSNPNPVENFLTPEQKYQEAIYCFNDLELTNMLMNNLDEQMALREKMAKQYVINVMSASDAQIAEKVIAEEIKKRSGQKIEAPHIAPGFQFKYDVPDWVQFINPEMKELLEELKESVFVVGENGRPQAPLALDDREVVIGEGVYRMGIGGLHSSEKTQAVTTDDGSYLVDVDVASYYPAIILNNQFFPEHIGELFLEVYQDLVDRRLRAKKAGQKADSNSLKIVINGMFGKLGSKWSKVYSPKLLVQVTLTGQLALLMLIEYANHCGLKVVSANTDGVVFHLEDEAQIGTLAGVVGQWEEHTGFVTEETPYKALYSRDVNNYIALKPEGEAKTKGAYLQPKGIFRFHKNPDCNIVSKAVIAFVEDGTPLRDTIEGSTDITDFVVVRKVRGGAEFTGEVLGNVVRWYYSRHNKAHITYRKVNKAGNKNKVPRSEGAKLVQKLPKDFPMDIDYDKYVAQAEEALVDIGAVVPFSSELTIFTKEELDTLGAGC